MSVELEPKKEVAEESIGKELMKHAAIFQRLVDLDHAIFDLECFRDEVAGKEARKPEEPIDPSTPPLANFMEETAGCVARMIERVAVVEKELRGMLF